MANFITFYCAPKKEGDFLEKVESNSNNPVISNALSNRSEVTNVYLQTIILKVCNKNSELVLRAFWIAEVKIHTFLRGSVEKLQLKSVSKQTMIQGLFGGGEGVEAPSNIPSIILK